MIAIKLRLTDGRNVNLSPSQVGLFQEDDLGLEIHESKFSEQF